MTTDPKPLDLEAWALQAARKVAGDLNDRSGFDLGALDEEIELEIHEAWADIIAREARELVRPLVEALKDAVSQVGGSRLGHMGDHRSYQAQVAERSVEEWRAALAPWLEKTDA